MATVVLAAGDTRAASAQTRDGQLAAVRASCRPGAGQRRPARSSPWSRCQRARRRVCRRHFRRPCRECHCDLIRTAFATCTWPKVEIDTNFALTCTYRMSSFFLIEHAWKSCHGTLLLIARATGTISRSAMMVERPGKQLTFNQFATTVDNLPLLEYFKGAVPDAFYFFDSIRTLRTDCLP